MTAVLDSSAILAVLLDEPGKDAVLTALPDVLVSSVNLAEVVTRLIDLGRSELEAQRDVVGFVPFVRAFESAHAMQAASLRRRSKARGLSLGDRACLALAIREEAGAMTADRAWAGLDLGVEITLIR